MQGLILKRNEQGTSTSIEEIDLSTFSDAHFETGQLVKVKVHYSSLNYKDALAICHKGKIIKHYPLIPGIDFAGEVVEDPSGRFDKGQFVLLTGFGYGEKYCGGLAEFAFVKAEQLTLLPNNLTPKQAMIVGTAGFTAMLCVNALINAGVTPDKGEVVVTGATGGVGSTAIYLLHKLGYQVSAISGKTDSKLLTQLGVNKIYPRDTMCETAAPLQSQQFSGAIDTVGGDILANLLSKIAYGGCIAACGLANHYQLNTTVMPFILRNVRLQGIDSVYYPASQRGLVWEQLASALDQQYFDLIGQEISLHQVQDQAEKLLKGQISGRIAVKID
ncbi:oxidoreductase [Mergibacter septicus]|uniref:acrylyl-CoA reductase family protein n=1 Tax=Mergibacter septicus TaxID=221402 RepID=UPI001C789E6C|nr:acryloyl-CoA reductase [Mergibacter septicus]QDJ13606.1 oxidoreductase [Mergibacter septicus]